MVSIEHDCFSPRRQVPDHCRARICLLKGCETWFSPLHPLSRYCSEACGEAARLWSRRLAAQRCGWDQAQKVLALLGTYRRDDLLAALERAVRYGAFAAKSVERILAVQARPKTCWDRMAEEETSHLGELLSDDPTPPRPATEYQHLLFEESDQDDPTEEEDDTGQGDDEPSSEPS